MFKIEIISKEDIALQNFSSDEYEKFLYWPVSYNHLSYQKWKMDQLPAGNTLYFGVFENSYLKAIAEYQHNSYETGLLGFKCGALTQFFFLNELNETERTALVALFFSFFEKYRKSEQIKFCFLPLSNTSNLLSSMAQDAGYKYVLSWGSCFYDRPYSEPILPEGFFIDFNKRPQDFDQYMALVKNYFKGGRFYLDQHIPNDKADKLYQDLVKNTFESEKWQFITLYNEEERVVGYFIIGSTDYYFDKPFKVASLRLLVMNPKTSQKGLATRFLNKASNLLIKNHHLVVSGLELHNLPSLRIHHNTGYRFNYVFSAYHSWI